MKHLWIFLMLALMACREPPPTRHMEVRWTQEQVLAEFAGYLKREQAIQEPFETQVVLQRSLSRGGPFTELQALEARDANATFHVRLAPKTLERVFWKILEDRYQASLNGRATRVMVKEDQTITYVFQWTMPVHP